MSCRTDSTLAERADRAWRHARNTTEGDACPHDGDRPRGELRWRHHLVVPLWVLGVAGSVIAISLVGIPARATYGARLSGDEPQYLLTATSLAEDHDLDISDEIADHRYSAYHEARLDQQTIPLGESGSEVSPHDPGLPILLALPMGIGGWVGAKAALAAVAGLTAGLTAMVAHSRWRVPRTTAALTTIACFSGIPLSSYATQVYPEMPAALATLCVAWGVTSNREPPDGTNVAPTVIAGVSLVALPWLSVKYVPVAAVGAAALLLRARGDRRVLVAVIGALGVAAAVYLAAHRHLYGGWTVYSTGDHFSDSGEFSVVGTQIDLLGRSRRLAGLLVDRDFGMAVWSPIWFLLPFAVFASSNEPRDDGDEAPLQRRLPTTWPLLAMVAAAWLNASFVALTMHGWWVPGRQVVVALPLAAILIAKWASERPHRNLTVAALGAVGLVNWLWLAIEAGTDRRTLIFDFFDTASIPYRAISRLSPAGMGAGDDLGLVVWMLVIAAAVMAARARASRRPTTSWPQIVDR